MKLDKKVLEYFEKQRKQNEGPVCVLYIDAHGKEETTFMNECADDATIFSFAGIAGAVNYVKLHEKNGKMIPTSQHFRDIIKQIPNASPRALKSHVYETADMVRPLLREHHEESFLGHSNRSSAKWTRKHLDKVLTPMKQLTTKRYTFFEPNESERERFDFGVYIMNVSCPDMEYLVGENLISCEFSEKNPEVGEYLKKISENRWNKVWYEQFPMDSNCVRTLTFKEIIHILKMLGFKYSYIFDGSCRSTQALIDSALLKTDAELYEKLAKKERNISLKKLSFKMKSADRIKSRKRILSDKINSMKYSMKSLDIPRAKVKQDFHDKLEYDIVTIVDNIKDIISEDENIQELYFDEINVIVEDTDKMITFTLYANQNKILTCKIFIHFLKITNIKISQENLTPLKEREPILYREIIKVKKMFIEDIKNLKF